jgi:hypothetical protein
VHDSGWVAGSAQHASLPRSLLQHMHLKLNKQFQQLIA